MDRRKILLIFAAAWVSAALLTWFLYASTKTPRVEKTIAILAAARDMAAVIATVTAIVKIAAFIPESPRIALPPM